MSSTFRRRIRTIVAATGLSTVGLMVGAGSASAHVSIAETEQVAGAYALLTFGVPHGCDGSPTTEVRIQVPESIPDVTPTVNPNWDLDIVTEKLQKPITDAHGARITERESEVVYTAKEPLADGLRDAFVLSLQIPEDAAGQTLHFPTIQTCAAGETAWIEIPEAGQSEDDLELPAPSVEVVAATDAEAESGHGGATPEEETASSTPPSSAVGVATPDTAGPEPDIGGSAPDTVATAPAEGDDDDDSSNGLAIAALAVGVAGLGVGGTALARQRRQ